MGKNKQLLSLHWVHWFVVGASLLITIFAWQFSTSQIADRIEARFNREADHAVELIRERMLKYEDGLAGGVAAISAFDHNVSYQQWKKFSQSLHIQKKYPGINGIGVIYQVQPKDLESFLKVHRKERPQFKIHPEHNMNEYWPITYVEPVSINAKAIGLDMAHETNRFTAAKKARDTGEPIITGPIVLVQDKSKTPGFLFYAPFYASPKLDTVEDRQREFLGLVYAPFVMKNLMRGVLKREKRQVAVAIRDQGQLLYDEHDTLHEDSDPNPLFTKKIQFDFYGRSWDFDVRSTQTFRKAAKNTQPLIILLGGLFVDLLLLTFFIILSNSNKRAIRYAKKMTEKAEEQRAAAVNASKLAALGEMAANVAHEINNPLTVISGAMMKVRLLMKKKKITDLEIINLVNKAEETVFRIAKIVRGMRTLSRDGSSDPMEPCLVKDLIGDALEICRQRFKSKGLKLDAPQDIPHVKIMCRRVEVSQVIINLLNNAFDAASECPSPWVRLRLRHEKGIVRFEISDSGPGISEELAIKILKPFFTTKPVGKGTGLGLSISKSIIEAHQGHFFLDRSQKNTTFVIELYEASDLKRVA